MVRAGLGRSDITVFEPGAGLFGYGTTGNVALGVARPLYARALVVEGDDGKRAAWLCMELGFVSSSLRNAIVTRLSELFPGLDDDTVMVTATHTHSGPNGYSSYLFFAATAPGFFPRVHEALVEGAVSAVCEAALRLRHARLTLHAERVPLAEPVAFNRALEAWRNNPEALAGGARRADEAVDRTLTVLRVDDHRGRPLGLVTWFASHGTTVKSENTLLHPDHHGVAAADCEARARDALGARDFVAIFAQGAAGDVSPCFRWSHQRGRMLGPHDDDLRSAEETGAILARHAWRTFLAAPTLGRALDGFVQGQTLTTDFSRAAVDPDLAGGAAVSTAPGRLGLAFAEGTSDGPGPLFHLSALRRGLVRLETLRGVRPGDSHDERMQHPKPPWYDVGLGARGRALGLFSPVPAVLKHLPDARARYFYDAVVSGREASRPWVPHALPTQVLLVGGLAVVGVPVEPTTVAGARLRETALASLRHLGVTDALVSGYANAYASYLCTPEEYLTQHYEAACTLFGRWTLPAFQTCVRRLAEAFALPRPSLLVA